MQYFFLAILILISIVFFYKLVYPVARPDTSYYKSDVTKLKENISLLAKLSRKTEPKGKGLSIAEIKKPIKKAYRLLMQKSDSGQTLLPCENWIADNYYKLFQSINALKPKMRTFANLPHKNDYPTLYLLCDLVIKSNNGLINKEIMEAAVTMFNAGKELKYEELISLKAMTEYVLLEYVAIISTMIVSNLKTIKKAKKDAQNKKIDTTRIWQDDYIASLAEEINGEMLAKLRVFCLDNGIELSERKAAWAQSKASFNASLSCSISSLFNLDSWMQDKFILSVSPVNQLFVFKDRKDYLSVLNETKMLYLKTIGERARKKGSSERATAEEIIYKSEQENRDIAFNILPNDFKRISAFFYGVFILALFVILTVFFALVLREKLLIFLPISAPILLVISVMIVKMIINASSKRRYLPLKDVEQSDPVNSQTAIVVPRLVATKAEIAQAREHLETIIAANNESIFSYYLLLDLPASACAKLNKNDEEIIEEAKREYEKFIEKSRVTLLIRNRKKVEKENVFQGYEKKRGAIIQFNNALLTKDVSDFLLVLGSVKNHEYAITLDSDTLTNECYRLVQFKAHPYCKDVTILSINMATNPESNTTYFSKLFSGENGVGSYKTFLPDVENDLFGKGNYTGKGIYNIKKFQEVFLKAFPDNTILSHDYIEGAYSACYNTDVKAVDDYPTNFSSYHKRNLRWLRGDIQLMPFLKSKVRNKDKEKVKNVISGVSKWHIFFNIIQSFVQLSSLLLIGLSMLAERILPLLIVGLSLQIIYLLFSIRASALSFKNKWVLELARQVASVVYLPIIAINNLITFFISCYRLITKYKLLSWQVFSHDSRRVSLKVNVLAATIFIVAPIVFSLNPVYYVFAGLFLCVYPLNYFLSRKVEQKECDLSEILPSLKETAKRTFDFYNAQLTSKNNYLPSDNYQEAGNKGWANRTSPTNIGFLCVGLACGNVLGYLKEEELNSDLEKILNSVEKLPKWNGLLYNWVNIESMEKLNGFVSSVDCGNFLACLTLVKEFCNAENANRINKIILESKIEKLYDFERGLLYIGYNDDTKSYSENHYDLMGSESSLTYLIASGLNKIPKSSVNNLSTLSVKYKGECFYSWTGGMFEYLMCSLFFDFPQNTTMYKSNNNVVKSQIAFAKENNFEFFGVSESQYNDLDDNGFYLYKAFGIPNLAFSSKASAKAIAPYATFLGASYNVAEFKKSYLKMLKLDMLGKYGLFEAYSVGDVVIKTYMSHHQGMLLLALTNLISGNLLKTRLKNNSAIRAAQLLTTVTQPLKTRKKIKVTNKKSAEEKVEVITEKHVVPYYCYLSNGGVSLKINEQGNNALLKDGKNILREQGEKDGLQIFLINDEKAENGFSGRRCVNLLNGNFVSSNHEATFNYRDDNCLVFSKVFLLPKNDAQIVSVSVKNTSNRPKTFRIGGYGEVILATKQSDLSHKVFSSMKITTKLAKNSYILAKRDGENLLAGYYCLGGDTAYESDKYNVFERGKKEISFGSVLEPVFFSRTTLPLEVGEEKTLYFCIVLAFDEISLSRVIELTKTCSFFDIISGAIYSVSNEYALDATSKRLGDKINSAVGTVTDKSLAGKINASYPIITIKIQSINGIELLRENLTKTIKMFRFCKFNLAITYAENSNSFLTMTDKINTLISELQLSSHIPSGCVFLLVNSLENSSLSKALVDSSVMAFQDDDKVLRFNKNSNEKTKAFNNAEMPPIKFAKKLGDNCGFVSDSSFAINLTNFTTPSPYSNVIADKTFGTVITESGGGYTYFDNSRENKLTSWSNDPVLDPVSELIVISEGQTLWSVTKKPIKTPSEYHVFHGLGYTRWENNYNGVLSSLTEFIALEENTKFYLVKIKNAENILRNFNVLFAANITLGDNRANTLNNLIALKKQNTLLAKNTLKNSVAVISSSLDIQSYSFSSYSFCDENNEIFTASSLENLPFNGTLALSVGVEIGASQETTFAFSLSSHQEPNFQDLNEKMKKAVAFYSNLSKLKIISGFGSSEYLAKWLPYQTLTSRFWGKTGFYQAGGATGFRDQLQDCMTILFINPKLVRDHIIDCASHQFEKGDVQHWWHAPDIGVRTRFCDDRLFLPFIIAEYISFTQDFTILEERAPYLNNVEMPRNIQSVYSSPGYTERKESILEHAEKALSISCNFGERGLVLMGGGDWNDGMDEVGHGGLGESVWCSMFLFYCVKKFLPFITDHDNRRFYVTTLKKLKDAVNNCFDGEWFVRAYKDDGSVIGSIENKECKIDLLTQAWAEISEITTVEKRQIALYSAADRLIDKKNKLIKLLDPPFKNSEGIGYISSYPLGVRENGGQYTHAAIWYIISLFKSGNDRLANNLMQMINPIYKTDSNEGIEKYRVEPYVIAADVYSGDSFGGRGGWTWYTGAASWYYRAITDYQIGLKIKGKGVSFSPKLPNSVTRLRLSIRFDGGEVFVSIDNTVKEGDWKMFINGIEYNSLGFTLKKEMVGQDIVYSRK